METSRIDSFFLGMEMYDLVVETQQEYFPSSWIWTCVMEKVCVTKEIIIIFKHVSTNLNYFYIYSNIIFLSI